MIALHRPPLTERERAVWLAIRRSYDERGYAPTVRELMAETEDRSRRSVGACVRSLMAKGYIRKRPSRERAITLTDRNEHFARQMASLATAFESGETIVETARKTGLTTNYVAMAFRLYDWSQAG